MNLSRKMLYSNLTFISKRFLGGAAPMVFTEQGVAMLSSVLNSKRAIEVNIQIMRAFVKIKQFALANQELAGKIEQLEEKYDKQFRAVFEAIKQLMQKPEKEAKRIGF